MAPVDGPRGDESGKLVMWELDESGSPRYKGCTDQAFYRSFLDYPQFGANTVFALRVAENSQKARHFLCIRPEWRSCRESDSGLVFAREGQGWTIPTREESRRLEQEGCRIRFTQDWSLQDKGATSILRIKQAFRLEGDKAICAREERTIRQASPNGMGIEGCEIELQVTMTHRASVSPPE